MTEQTNGDWEANRRLVISSLDELKATVSELRKQQEEQFRVLSKMVTDLRVELRDRDAVQSIDIATLKTKVAYWSAGIGGGASALVAGLYQLFKHAAG